MTTITFTTGDIALFLTVGTFLMYMLCRLFNFMKTMYCNFMTNMNKFMFNMNMLVEIMGHVESDLNRMQTHMSSINNTGKVLENKVSKGMTLFGMAQSFDLADKLCKMYVPLLTNVFNMFTKKPADPYLSSLPKMNVASLYPYMSKLVNSMDINDLKKGLDLIGDNFGVKITDVNTTPPPIVDVTGVTGVTGATGATGATGPLGATGPSFTDADVGDESSKCEFDIDSESGDDKEKNDSPKHNTNVDEINI
ncbi:MAG: hypothetical protein Edafosvirus18_4 [Edafosvirus sp.]|uniref:Uncharacterized protein n=1 Tax=Edafosvirus sp. TaxID=2487765 RepID=A0A3G4ZUI7_9VIRU|nr:MAG: hypothetical protein Edafosvirus18_4 [Edafosvirus sp.]